MFVLHLFPYDGDRGGTKKKNFFWILSLLTPNFVYGGNFWWRIRISHFWSPNSSLNQSFRTFKMTLRSSLWYIFWFALCGRIRIVHWSVVIACGIFLHLHSATRYALSEVPIANAFKETQLVSWEALDFVANFTSLDFLSRGNESVSFSEFFL